MSMRDCQKQVLNDLKLKLINTYQRIEEPLFYVGFLPMKEHLFGEIVKVFLPEEYVDVGVIIEGDTVFGFVTNGQAYCASPDEIDAYYTNLIDGK